MSAKEATPRGEKVKFVVFLLGVVAVLALLGQLVGRRTDTTAPGSTTRLAQPPIPYIEVESWPIQRRDTVTGQVYAIGHGRVIVIDSSYRTEEGLRRLGDQLHRASPSTEQQTFFEVYTDSASAARRQRSIAEKLSRAQQQRHDRHNVGVYIKNRFTGHESWTFGLKGLTGDSTVEVTY